VVSVLHDTVVIELTIPGAFDNNADIDRFLSAYFASYCVILNIVRLTTFALKPPIFDLSRIFQRRNDQRKQPQFVSLLCFGAFLAVVFVNEMETAFGSEVDIRIQYLALNSTDTIVEFLVFLDDDTKVFLGHDLGIIPQTAL